MLIEYITAKRRSKRMIDGTAAQENEFPYQAQIRFKDDKSHICGGTIISEWYILSAAHCFFDDDNNIYPYELDVVVGSIYLDGRSGTVYNVRKYYYPQLFSREYLDKDISLVQVSRTFLTNTSS